jgi:type I restriction enzyme S subunit
MTSIETLLTNHLDVWTSAIARKSSAGRGRSKKYSLYGIDKLRALILDLAVRGKLVPQDPTDEPASELLKQIDTERRQLISSGKVKRGRPLEALDRVPFSVPTVWAWSQLGAVTNYGDTEKQNPGDVDPQTWVLELEDVEKETSRLIERVRYSERQFQSQKNRFYPGDVIYGKLRPYLDKVLIADEAGVCTTEMVPIRPYAGLEATYLRLFLKAPYFITLASTSTHGMNLPRLGTDRAREAPIAIPPLAEQHRIVAKVDKLMALCDRLEAESYAAIDAHRLLLTELLATLTASSDARELTDNWARLAAHFDALFITEDSVDQLKQTVLDLAVMGKLVPQDSNEEPASKLLERTRKDIANFALAQGSKPVPIAEINGNDLPFELPSGWRWTRLAAVFNVITDGDHQPPPKVSDGIAFLTIGNIATGQLDFRDCRFVSEEYFQAIPPYRTPAHGDILYTVVGATYGRPALVETNRPFCVQRHIAILKPAESMDRRFLVWLLSSKFIYLQASESITGTAQPTIPLRPLRNFLIPLPPLVEQGRIVAKIDHLMELCDALRTQLRLSIDGQVSLADAAVAKAIG